MNSLPLKLAVNLLMIWRGIGLPESSLRCPLSMTWEISVLISMISPVFTPVGRWTRAFGFAAIVSSPYPAVFADAAARPELRIHDTSVVYIFRCVYEQVW